MPLLNYENMTYLHLILSLWVLIAQNKSLHCFHSLLIWISMIIFFMYQYFKNVTPFEKFTNNFVQLFFLDLSLI
jgi:hypothetical protein